MQSQNDTSKTEVRSSPTPNPKATSQHSWKKSKCIGPQGLHGLLSGYLPYLISSYFPLTYWSYRSSGIPSSSSPQGLCLSWSCPGMLFPRFSHDSLLLLFKSLPKMSTPQRGFPRTFHLNYIPSSHVYHHPVNFYYFIPSKDHYLQFLFSYIFIVFSHSMRAEALSVLNTEGSPM
jgi:hypothetical protein